MRVRSSAAIVLGVLTLAPLVLTRSPRAQERVDYDRQIRPIFEQACYECHGPSKGRGQLRLHDRVLALKGGLSGPSILPGHASDSPLVHRIMGLGDDDRMPLKKEALTAEQIELVKAWIDQGATWPVSPTSTSTSSQTPANSATSDAAASSDPPQHWAYVKPQRPELPAATRTGWAKTPVDRFILARLEQEGLSPSAEASKAALLRRVSLDLIGLPPTIAELDAFLADQAPDAYDRVVDRLLASPRFGERWARPWLDLARYADSNGFEKDNLRTAWKYRDWVIDALNADMPFDRFTIEQLAGDMLPNATAEQKIASGFHRNAMTNEEGGVDPEESLFDVLVDRVNTTSAVWLGSTVGCAQCHNHKYDPFSQKDYYRLMAFFQNTDYTSRTFGDGTRYAEGQLDLATPAQEARRTELQQQITNRERSLARETPALAAAQAQWERKLRDDGLEWSALKPSHATATNDVVLTIAPDNSIAASGPNPAQTIYTIVATTPLTEITGVRVEALPDARLPKGGPGRDPYGHFRLTGITVEAEPADLHPPAQAAQGSARTRTTSSASRRPAGTAAAVRAPLAVSHHASAAGPQPVPLTRISVDDATGRIDSETFLSPEAAKRDSRTAWTIDAMRDEARFPRQAVLTAERPFGYATGTRLTIRLAHLDGTLGQGVGRFRLSVTGTRSPEHIVSISARLRAALVTPVDKRTPKQLTELTTRFRVETPLLQREREALEESRTALADLRIPTTLVMREKISFERPSAYLRERGAFNAKGALLYANVPAALNPMPESEPMNRLGLARWLVSRDNPLTARVAVNRLWEQLFGRGLVETSEDFGTQGSPPSHPALLDWLAVEFMDQQHWSQKAILRLLVTSATYRQDARVTPTLLERDPYNRLLARGPRFRLEAETIRDAALASSGLLSAKMHGPSVFPLQPAGIWNNPYNPDTWKTSEGEDRHRRALYTFIRRTSPYPSMLVFDATSREFCTIRRVRTNTPLQALAMLNDEVYVEAARGLAGRVREEGGGTDETRLAYAMRLILSRTPSDREVTRLRALLETQRKYYAAHPDDAQKLITARPEEDEKNAERKEDAASKLKKPRTAAGTSSTGSAVKASRTGEAMTDSGTSQKMLATAPTKETMENAIELAAWIIVSNVLLNLDEMQTKG